MARKTSRFPALDAEPKSAQHLRSLPGWASPISRQSLPGGPPPPYHRSSGFLDDDSLAWSDCSFQSSGGLGKRRASWTNLVESDDNLRSRISAPPAIAVADGRYFGVVNEYPLGKIPGGGSSRHNSCNTSTVSEFILMPKGAVQKLNGSSVAGGDSAIGGDINVTTAERRPKRDRMQDLRDFCSKTRNRLIILILIVLIAIAIIVAIVVTQAVVLPSNFSLSWLAPAYLRNGQNSPNTIRMSVIGQQIRFDQHGSTPFTGDFIAVYDFRTQKVVVIDGALKSNGRNLACFVLNLNRTTMPDIPSVQDAAKHSLSRSQQNDGWQETWQFVPEPMSNVQPGVLFQPPVGECNGSRWIQLNYVQTNQKAQKCSDCYDFCLPEYGIERDTVRGENYLNIVRRDCFYLFVPEWRSFAQAYNSEQNQKDFELYYQHQRNGGQMNGGGNPNLQSQSRWISLQSIPQSLANMSSQALNTVSGAIGNAATNLQNAFMPNQNSNYPQQQLSYPGQIGQYGNGATYGTSGGQAYGTNGGLNGLNQQGPINGQQPPWQSANPLNGQQTLSGGVNLPNGQQMWNAVNSPNDRQAWPASSNSQQNWNLVNALQPVNNNGPAPFPPQPQFASAVQPPLPDFTSMGDPVQRQVNYASGEKAQLPAVFVFGGNNGGAASTQAPNNYNGNYNPSNQQLNVQPGSNHQTRQVLTAMNNWPEQGFAGGGTNTPSSLYYVDHPPYRSTNNNGQQQQPNNYQNGQQQQQQNSNYQTSQQQQLQLLQQIQQGLHPAQQGLVGTGGPFVDLSETNSRRGRTLPLEQPPPQGGAWINVGGR